MNRIRAAALIGFALLPTTAHGQSGFYTIAVVRDGLPAAVSQVTVSAMVSWNSMDDFEAIWVLAKVSDGHEWQIVPIQSIQVIPPVFLECTVGPKQTGLACRRSRDIGAHQQVIHVTLQTDQVPTLLAVELGHQRTGRAPNLELSEWLRARAMAALLNTVDTENRGLLLASCGSDCGLTYQQGRFVSIDPERKIPISSELRHVVREWLGLSDPLEIVWPK